MPIERADLMRRDVREQLRVGARREEFLARAGVFDRAVMHALSRALTARCRWDRRNASRHLPALVKRTANLGDVARVAEAQRRERARETSNSTSGWVCVFPTSDRPVLASRSLSGRSEATYAFDVQAVKSHQVTEDRQKSRDVARLWRSWRREQLGSLA